MARKLRARRFADTTVEAVLAQLQTAGLQSDERFVESFVYHRVSQGYGPLRIRRELRQHRISDECTQPVMHKYPWPANMARLREKRFGKILPEDIPERLRQARFLHYRGFETDQINQLLHVE